MRSASAGFAAAELVVAGALAGLLLALFGGLQAAALRQARELGVAAAVADLERTAALLLPAELRFLDPSVDIAAVSADSLRLRAFRATAVVCAAGTSTADGAVLAVVEGMRLPEPAKDSALLVSVTPERTYPILDAAPASVERGREAAARGCATDGGRLLVLRLGSSIPAGALLLIFETGSYHLADGALRYRRGDGGRQPVTLEWLDSRRSGFVAARAAPRLSARWRVRPPGPPRASADATLPLRSLNERP